MASRLTSLHLDCFSLILEFLDAEDIAYLRSTGDAILLLHLKRSLSSLCIHMRQKSKITCATPFSCFPRLKRASLVLHPHVASTLVTSDLVNLPDQLEELSIHVETPPKFNSSITPSNPMVNFSPQITRVAIYRELAFLRKLIWRDAWGQHKSSIIDWQSLPSSLAVLVIDSPILLHPTIINELPRTLIELKISLSQWEDKQTPVSKFSLDWPSSLTDLQLIHPSGSHQHCQWVPSLPTGLLVFSTPEILTCENLSLLPSGLQKLSVKVYALTNEALLSMPKSLEYLRVVQIATESENLSLALFPRTLKYLAFNSGANVSSMFVEQLKDLPDGLEELESDISPVLKPKQWKWFPRRVSLPYNITIPHNLLIEDLECVQDLPSGKLSLTIEKTSIFDQICQILPLSVTRLTIRNPLYSRIQSSAVLASLFNRLPMLRVLEVLGTEFMQLNDLYHFSAPQLQRMILKCDESPAMLDWSKCHAWTSKLNRLELYMRHCKLDLPDIPPINDAWLQNLPVRLNYITLYLTHTMRIKTSQLSLFPKSILHLSLSHSFIDGYLGEHMKQLPRRLESLMLGNTRIKEPAVATVKEDDVSSIPLALSSIQVFFVDSLPSRALDALGRARPYIDISETCLNFNASSSSRHLP